MKNDLITSYWVDSLEVKVFKNREALGRNAALEFGKKMKEIGLKKQLIRMIFAAAPSQNEFLENLVKNPDLPWPRSIAFHMDEYLQLEKGHPALFQLFLEEKLFSKLSFREVNFIDPFRDPEESLKLYADKLIEDEIDMIALGIGV